MVFVAAVVTPTTDPVNLFFMAGPMLVFYELSILAAWLIERSPPTKGTCRMTSPRRTDFEATLGFAPDPFQTQAIDALVAGRSVLVAAPTGAGKTVVGEFCCHDALQTSGKTFYTTPIKALSNQKYRDLVDRYGEDQVGLLTGDRSINGEAPVVVMTTEVLRNMLYEASPTLRGLRYVVLDEVHYLADRSRGAVWEEVLILLPASVQVAALSATVSNAEEFGDWLDVVRDGCEVIIEETPPRPTAPPLLRQRPRLPDLPRRDTRARPPASTATGPPRRWPGCPTPTWSCSNAGPPGPARGSATAAGASTQAHACAGRRAPRWSTSWRAAAGCPAIIFVFSRAGCEKAVQELVRSGIRLTTREERDEIARTVDTLLADLPAEDLAVLDHATWRAALLDGIAAHHAGMVPAFKEAVEVCFQMGPAEGRDRHRDAGARDQHAGPHGRHRAAREVERRDPRHAHRRGSTPS